MADLKDTLDKLTKVIENFDKNIGKVPQYIKNGIEVASDTQGAINIGNPNDKRPGYTYNRDERDKFIEAITKQSRQDARIEKMSTIDDQIDEIRKYKDSVKGLHKITAQAQIKNLEREKANIGSGKAALAESAAVSIAKVSAAVEGVVNLAQGVLQIGMGIAKANLAQQKNLFERTQKSFQVNMEMSNVVASNIVTAMTSFATQTATEAGRALSKGAKEEANARIKQFTGLQMAEREYEVARKETEIQRQKEIVAGGTKAANAIGGIAALFGPVGMIVGGVINMVAGIASAAADAQIQIEEFNLEKQKQQNEVYQQMMGNISQVADKMKKIVDGIDDTANSIADVVRQSDTTYKHMSMTLGFSGDNYSKYMRHIQVETSKYFNITAEQMEQMQQSFTESSGRSKIMTADEYNQMTAISKTFGASQGEVANILGEMNIFNVGIASGYDKFDKMYHSITKMGLSTTKYTKELSNNLKLAQKYNFKGGLDNMMKITQWAQQTRFNLNSATAFADKLMGGSLSDTLTTSAKLQVLGGAASIYADPLAMMYEAGTDIGDLAKRQAAMFKDITGTVNQKTGEVDFDWYDERMIRARAEAAGLNPEDVKNQKRQEAKQGVIGRQLKGLGLDKQTIAALSNRAEYVEGKGFMVNTINGPESLEKVAAMKAEDRDKILMPENEEAAIMDIAKNTRSLVEQEEANTKLWQSLVGENLYGVLAESSEKLKQAQADMFNNPAFMSGMKESIKSQTDQAVAELQNLTNFLKDPESQKAVTDYRTFVTDQLGRSNVLQQSELAILSTLGKENGIENVSAFSTAVAKIAAEGNEKERKKLIEEAKKNPEISDMFNSWLSGSEYATEDSVGSLNGGYITNATHVTPINDGLVKTHKADQYLAAKPNGPIDKLFDGIIGMITEMYDGNAGRGGSNNLNVSLNGKLDIVDRGSSINLVDMIRNDSALASRFIKALARAMECEKQGKPNKNYMV